ncbi:MAG: hypothetical protein N0A03_07550 [Anaerolineae bacterium]|nr:hypothetical protein [Anaerolineae bacterium]
MRYALDYRHLGEGYFDLRTLLLPGTAGPPMRERGENLLKQAFEQVTDAQFQAFSLKTGKQQIDSTLLASNIRQMERLQLRVTSNACTGCPQKKTSNATPTSLPTT